MGGPLSVRGHEPAGPHVTLNPAVGCFKHRIYLHADFKVPQGRYLHSTQLLFDR